MRLRVFVHRSAKFEAQGKGKPGILVTLATIRRACAPAPGRVGKSFPTAYGRDDAGFKLAVSCAVIDPKLQTKKVVLRRKALLIPAG
jgi:hypothetical protein